MPPEGVKTTPGTAEHTADWAIIVGRPEATVLPSGRGV